MLLRFICLNQSLLHYRAGYFAMDVEAEQGDVFALYFFQMSFATTATTIVSGAMAERTHLNAYTIYSFTNTISYCFPAHWLWGEKGFLKELGVIDVAGKCSNVTEVDKVHVNAKKVQCRQFKKIKLWRCY